MIRVIKNYKVCVKRKVFLQRLQRMLSKGSARRLPFESIRIGIFSEKTRIIFFFLDRR